MSRVAIEMLTSISERQKCTRARSLQLVMTATLLEVAIISVPRTWNSGG